MRRYGLPEPYEQLKALTRGKTGMTRESLRAFIDGPRIAGGCEVAFARPYARNVRRPCARASRVASSALRYGLAAFAPRCSFTNVVIAGMSDTTTIATTISDRLSFTHGMLPNR